MARACKTLAFQAAAAAAAHTRDCWLLLQEVLDVCIHLFLRVQCKKRGAVLRHVECGSTAGSLGSLDSVRTAARAVVGCEAAGDAIRRCAHKHNAADRGRHARHSRGALVRGCLRVPRSTAGRRQNDDGTRRGANPAAQASNASVPRMLQHCSTQHCTLKLRSTVESMHTDHTVLQARYGGPRASPRTNKRLP